MSSFREQLRAGKFSTATINKKLHKFIGNFTTINGYCDYEVEEGNYFLLKSSHTNRKSKWQSTNR